MSNRPNNRSRSKIDRTPATAGPASQSFWQKPAVWILGLVLVAAAIAGISIVGANSSPPADVADETAFAEIIGNTLPAFSEPDSAVGTRAPSISAETLSGERVQISNDDGVARLYGFFAHWCPVCQAELPEASAWLTDNPLPDNVEVVAISTSVDSSRDNFPPSDWFEREEWPNTVLLDGEDSALATGFGLTAFPFWVAVDGDGNIASRASGQLDEQSFLALVDQLDASSQ